MGPKGKKWNFPSIFRSMPSLQQLDSLRKEGWCMKFKRHLMIKRRTMRLKRSGSKHRSMSSERRIYSSKTIWLSSLVIYSSKKTERSRIERLPNSKLRRLLKLIKRLQKPRKDWEIWMKNSFKFQIELTRWLSMLTSLKKSGKLILMSTQNLVISKIDTGFLPTSSRNCKSRPKTMLRRPKKSILH